MYIPKARRIIKNHWRLLWKEKSFVEISVAKNVFNISRISCVLRISCRKFYAETLNIFCSFPFSFSKNYASIHVVACHRWSFRIWFRIKTIKVKKYCLQIVIKLNFVTNFPLILFFCKKKKKNTHSRSDLTVLNPLMVLMIPPYINAYITST